MLGNAVELQQDREDARGWGGGWVLSCVSAAAALPGQERGRQLVILHQAEGVDVFSCPDLSTRCAAQFDKHCHRLEILTAVTCWCVRLLVTKAPEEGMGCFPLGGSLDTLLFPAAVLLAALLGSCACLLVGEPARFRANFGLCHHPS